MIKVKILKESIYEELLDEAKEDKLYDAYWGNDRHLERKFRRLLVWVYGRHFGPGQWQGVSSEMMKMFKKKGNEFAPKRQQRIKYLDWGSDMLKLGYMVSDVIDSLELFEKFSPQFKERSIKAYESPDAILSTYKEEVVMKRVSKARKERGKSEPKATEEDRTVIYQDDNLFVIRPHNVKASCHYGRKTKWCIAQPGNDYFREYTEEEGLIFYFIKDDRRKPDDRYSKIAIQISGDAEEIEFDGFWDRYDNEGFQPMPRDIGELPDFYREEEITKAIRAIQAHAKENPPQKGEAFHLEQLDQDIYQNQFDTNYISLYSQVEEGWDRPLIHISANASLRIEIAELEDVSRGEYESAYSEMVDEIEEAVTDWVTSNVENVVHSSWNSDESIIIENGTVHGSYVVHFNIESFSFSSHENAREYAEQLRNEFSEENHSNWNIELSEVFMEQLSRHLGAEGRVRIEDFARELLSFESKLNNFEGHYDEDDADITFSQKKPFVLPLKIKGFNLPVKGYSHNAMVKNKIRQYQRNLGVFVRTRFQAAVKEAMQIAHERAHKFALAQLPLPGIKAPRNLPDSLPVNYEISVGVPSPDEIRGVQGTKAKLDAPTIRSGINIIVDKGHTEQEMEGAKMYIKWLDANLDEVYEIASSKIDFDKIQKRINDDYAKIFVDSGEIQGIKHSAGVGQETYTESKRRIKIRIR